MKNETLKTILLLIISMLLTLLFFTLGFSLRNVISHGNIFCIAILIILAVLLAYNLIHTYHSAKSSEHISVQQQVDFFLSRHENTTERVDESVKRLKHIQLFLTVYFVFLFLLATLLSFFSGTSNENTTLETLSMILSIYLIFGFLYCLSSPKEYIDEAGYIKPEESPVIYQIARRAMEAYGIKGNVRIFILADYNAGICKAKDFYSLQLGINLLYVLTEEELFQILLHEFAHMSDPYLRDFITPKYLKRILEYETESTLAQFFSLMILVPAEYYRFESAVYDISASEIIERRADLAAIEKGSPHVYASALAKVSMSDYFDFENKLFFKESPYSQETPNTAYCTLTCITFEQALKERRTDWLNMLNTELPPLIGSHPTFRQRYEMLGNCDFTIDFPSDDSPYRKDCMRALSIANREVFQSISDDYNELREEYYLKPLKQVEVWENGPQLIGSEDMSSLIQAYDYLCRFEEAETLCEQIIKQSDNLYLTAFPLYYKGCLMLSRYDKSGIKYIYRAIDLNSNYIEEGMDMIGSFCAKMGLEAELNEYRKKNMEYEQKQIDVYDKGDFITRTDHLESEHFPDNRLPAILSYLTQAGDGQIEKIYLVRKIITEETFFSVFVIKWKDTVSDEVCENGMNKIFNYLDTYPDGWPFSLFLCNKDMERILKKVQNSCVYTCKGA